MCDEMQFKGCFAIFYISSVFICQLVLARVSRSNIFELEILSLNVSVDPEFMTVSQSITDKVYLDMNVTTHRPIQEGNTLFSLEIKIRAGAGKYLQSLLKEVNKDFCQYWFHASKDILLRLISGKLQNNTNYVGCPVLKNSYFFRNITANNIVPVGIISGGEYYIEATLKHRELTNGFANFSFLINIVN